MQAASSVHSATLHADSLVSNRASYRLSRLLSTVAMSNSSAAASTVSEADAALTPLTEAQSRALAGTCEEWRANIASVLLTSAAIEAKVRQLAAAISERYAGRRVLCVGLLTGAFVFLADLVRHLTIPYQVDFMVVSSYGHGTTSSGSVRLKKDMSLDPSGCDVLIIEDLIDTGTTLAWLRNHLATKRCASLAIACLLDKTARRTAEVSVDFVGFHIPDEFVVGYGMDFNDNYRCLPYIAVLKPEAYSTPN